MTATFADAIEAEKLPRLVAVQVAQIDTTTDAVARLKALLDLYENHLRLVAGLAVGELRRQLDAAPDDLARELLLDLSQPSWDNWPVIYRKAAALSKGAGLGFDLAPDAARFRKLTTALRNCRNESSHAPIRSWAEQKFNEFAPQVADALRDLTWLREIRLEVRVSTDSGEVRVPFNEDLEVDLARWSVSDAVVVAQLTDHHVSLYPFLVVAEHTDRALPFLGVSTGLEDSWDIVRIAGLATHSPAPKKHSHKQHSELIAFRKWCRYDEHDFLLGTLQNFDREFKQPPPLYGRSDQRKQVAKLLKDHRVVWVEAAAGSGKTLFIQHVAKALQNHWRVIYWRFQVGDYARSSQLPFLKHVASCLRRGREDDRLPKLGDDPRAWEREVRSLLEDPSDPVHSTVVVVDGLDECDDEWLRSVPFAFTHEGLRWLCAGRPTGQLRSIFNSDRCARWEDLGPLHTPHVKEWLEKEAPALLPRLDEIVERSEGLPQYLRLLFTEFGSGAIGAQDPLPRGMSLFWKEAIERAWKRCSGRARGICLKALQAVAVSVEPIDVITLREVLRRAGEFASDRIEDDHALIREALGAMRSLMKEELRDARPCYRPSHASLNDLLRDDEEYRNEADSIVRAFVSLVQSPTCTDPDVVTQVFRWGIRQLVAVGRVNHEVIDLLTNFTWVVDRLFRSAPTAIWTKPEVALRRMASLLGLIEDLDHVMEHSDFKDDPLEPKLGVIPDLKRLVATRLTELSEGGDQLFFQYCANGEIEYLKPRALDWRRTAATDWSSWLEFVASTSPDVSRHMLVEISLNEDVASMMFERDGHHLLVTHDKSDATRWDTRSGRRVGVIPGLRGDMLGIDANSGHLYVATAEEIETWNTQGGRIERVTSYGRQGQVRGVWKDADGRLLVATQEPTEALLMRAQDGDVLASTDLPTDLPSTFIIAQLSADAVLVGRDQGYLNGVAAGVAVPFNIVHEAFAVDHTELVSGTIVGLPIFSTALEIRDLCTFALRESVQVDGLLPGFRGRLADSTARGREGAYLAFGCTSGDLLLFNAQTRRARLVPEIHSGSFSVTLSPAGERIATAGSEPTEVIRIWNTEGLNAVEASAKGATSARPVMLIAIAPKADRVACLRDGGVVEWRRFSDGGLIEETKGYSHGSRVRGAVSFDGTCLALPSFGGIKVFDTATGEGHWIECGGIADDEIDDLSLGTDGKWVEVTDVEGKSSAWTVPGGERITDWSTVKSPPRGRHLEIDTGEPFHYEERDGIESRRTQVLDWDQDMRTAALGQRSLIHGYAMWWGRSRASACAVAQDGRVAIASEDGRIVFLRYRSGVPFTPQLVSVSRS